jgi:hypothetical protein
VEVEPVEPYTLEEIRTILSAAQQRRNAARWASRLRLVCGRVRFSVLDGAMWILHKAFFGFDRRGLGPSTSTAATGIVAELPSGV